MKLDKSKSDEINVECNNTNNGLIHKTKSQGDKCFIMSESEKRIILDEDVILPDGLNNFHQITNPSLCIFTIHTHSINSKIELIYFYGGKR